MLHEKMALASCKWFTVVRKQHAQGGVEHSFELVISLDKADTRMEY